MVLQQTKIVNNKFKLYKICELRMFRISDRFRLHSYRNIRSSHFASIDLTDSDIIFGSNLGMKTVRIAYANEIVKVKADLTIESLIELNKFIEI